MTTDRAERVSRIIQQVRAKRCTDPNEERLVSDLRRAWLLGDWTTFDRVAEALEILTRSGAN